MNYLLLWEALESPTGYATGDRGMVCAEQILYDELKRIGRVWNLKRPEGATVSRPSKALMSDERWQRVLSCRNATTQWNVTDHKSRALLFPVFAHGKGVIGRPDRVKKLNDRGFDWVPPLSARSLVRMKNMLDAVAEVGFVEAFQTSRFVRRYMRKYLTSTEPALVEVSWHRLRVLRILLELSAEAGLSDPASLIWVSDGFPGARKSTMASLGANIAKTLKTLEQCHAWMPGALPNHRARTGRGEASDGADRPETGGRQAPDVDDGAETVEGRARRKRKVAKTWRSGKRTRTPGRNGAGAARK